MAIALVTEFLEVELVSCMNLTPNSFSGEMYQIFVNARVGKFLEVHPALVLMAADAGRGRDVPWTLLALDTQLSFSL